MNHHYWNSNQGKESDVWRRKELMPYYLIRNLTMTMMKQERADSKLALLIWLPSWNQSIYICTIVYTIQFHFLVPSFFFLSLLFALLFLFFFFAFFLLLVFFLFFFLFPLLVLFTSLSPPIFFFSYGSLFPLLFPSYILLLLPFVFFSIFYSSCHSFSCILSLTFSSLSGLVGICEILESLNFNTGFYDLWMLCELYETFMSKMTRKRGVSDCYCNTTKTTHVRSW